MIKRILIVFAGTFIFLWLSLPVFASGLGLLALLVSPTHGNCPQALPITHPNFCASFRSVARCHCTTSGLPSGMCQDINAIYNRMISVFGSQQKACEYQKDTTTQICMDDWNCYRLGGKDSQGKLCSGTGKKC